MSKILIIEDEAAIRRVLTKILSEENDTYQVEEAEDGVVGFEKIKNKICGLQKQYNAFCHAKMDRAYRLHCYCHNGGHTVVLA